MEEKIGVEYIRPTFRLIIKNLTKDFFSVTKSNEEELIEKKVKEIEKYQDSELIKKLEKSQQAVKVIARRKQYDGVLERDKQKNGEVIKFEQRAKEIKEMRDRKIINYEEVKEDNNSRVI